MTINDNMRELPVRGTIFIGVKALNTPENSEVFKAFLDFAKKFCGDDRTVAIRKLLEYYEEDYKYDSLHRYVMSLEERISVLEASKKTVDNKPEEGLF